MQEDPIGAELDIDHIIPEALGGETIVTNLWLACSIPLSL
jgi:5-methylcytosine-specific restriction endonuclease McrA